MEKVMNKLLLVDETDREFVKLFVPSRLFHELKWKYLERRMRPYIAIVLVCWLLWMVNMVVAIGVLQTRPIITL